MNRNNLQDSLNAIGYSLRIIYVDRVRHLVEGSRFEGSQERRAESSRLLPISGVSRPTNARKHRE